MSSLSQNSVENVNFMAFSERFITFIGKQKTLRFIGTQIQKPTNCTHLGKKMALRMCQKVVNLDLITILKES